MASRRSSQLSYSRPELGRNWAGTSDLLLVEQALSQLS
jgi:hypothetical protein